MPQHDDDIIPHQDEVETVIEQETERKVKVYRASILYTPEAGFSPVGGYAYITGSDLAICNLSIKRPASVAVAVFSWNQLGLLDPAFAPAANIGFNFVGAASIYRDDATAAVFGYGGIDSEENEGVPTDHFLAIRSFGALAAAADHAFVFHSLRYPLLDVDAAQALLATGDQI